MNRNRAFVLTKNSNHSEKQSDTERKYVSLKSKIQAILNDPNISSDDKDIILKKIQIVEDKRMRLEKIRFFVNETNINCQKKNEMSIQNDKEKKSEMDINREQYFTAATAFDNISRNFLPNQSTFSFSDSETSHNKQFIDLQSNFDALVDEVATLKKQITMATAANNSAQMKLGAAKNEKESLTNQIKDLTQKISILQEENEKLSGMLQRNRESTQRDPKYELLEAQTNSIRKLLSKFTMEDFFESSDSM